MNGFIGTRAASKGARLVVLSAAALALAGCGGSDIRDALGLTKNAPDEFAIVTKAPLIIPPEFALRPPQPGAPRPASTQPRAVAKKAVFGSDGEIVTASLQSQGESVLLNRAGAADADPNIRSVVNAETRSLAEKNETFVDDVIFWNEQTPPDEHLVNASAEQRRLRQNEAEGKPVTEGETPSIKPERKGWLEGIF